MSRRAFMGGALAGSGLATLGMAPRAATAMPPYEAPRLLADPSAPEGFVDGARAALTASGLGGVAIVEQPSPGALFDTIAWLKARSGRRLIGLLASSEAVLLQQIVGGERMRWLSLAQHGQGGAAAFAIRHHVTGLPSNRGLARRLAIELAAAGTDFAIVEQPLAGRGDTLPGGIPGFLSYRDQSGLVHVSGISPIDGCQALGRASASLVPHARCAGRTTAAQSWDSVLGESLGLIAVGRWAAQPSQPSQVFLGRGQSSSLPPIALTSFVVVS